MIETYLRAPLQKRVIDPIAKCLCISPTILTLSAVAFALLGLGMFFLQATFLGLLFFALSGLLDVFDGSVARLHHKTSALGTVLDLTLDRVVEVTMIFSLLQQGEGRGYYCIWMLSSMYVCVASFFSVTLYDACKKASPHNKSFAYSPGVIERAETFIFFFLMILFKSQFVPLAIAYTILTLFTACVRLFEFKRSLLSAA